MAIKFLSAIDHGAYRLPTADGSDGQVLTTDGNGNITFQTVASSVNYYLSGASFNTGTGVLTLTVSGATDQTVDLDGRYALLNHVHNYDNYGSWNLKTNGIQRTTVQSGGDLNLVAGSNVSLSYSAGGTVTITSTDTNTDTNNYLTGASFSTSNGVLTLTRQGLGDITVDLDGRFTDNGYADALNQHLRTSDSPSFAGMTINGNLTVTGTTVTDQVEVVSTTNGILFEGSAADAYEGLLLAGTLTADRTYTLPNATGTVALTSDIPTVNNATLTVQGTGALGGSGTFTANASSNVTISISHDDTSTLSGLYGGSNNGVVIEDITVDGYGHVTAIGTIDLDGRFDNYGGWRISDSVTSELLGAGDTLTVTGAGATTVSYDAGTNTLEITSTDTNTNTTYSAGSGLSLSGTTFSHSDTSSASSVNNSGRTYIQDITIDTYGHVTAISSATETVTNTDTNYYLNGITKSGNTLTFAVTGATNQTYTFGSNAFTSYSNHVGLYDAAGSAAAVDSRIDTEVLPAIPTNNNQLINGAGYVTSSGNTVIGTDTDINTSGATIIDNLYMTDGVITSHGTRTLTPGDIGAAYYDHFRSLGTTAFTGGTNPNITTAQLISEMETDGAFDSYTSAFKTSWSYAGNYDLNDAGNFTETAGSSWLTWTDNSSDSTRGNITALAIAPNTGGSAGRVFIYNDQGASYSPGWREVWTNASLDPIINATASNDTITFTKANGGTFAVSTSDANTNYYVDGLSFDTATGVLTASVNGTTNRSVDLDGRYQLAGTYNTIIGTDIDIDTSGSTIIDNIYVTDGVITSMGTRTLTLADLGYSGATNADAYGSWTISDGTNSESLGSGATLTVTGTGATTASYDAASNTLTINSTDTNTNTTYSAGGGLSLSGTTFSHTDTSSQASVNNSGNTVIQDVTLDTYGHVTGLTSTTLTLSGLGYTGASNADLYNYWTIDVQGQQSNITSTGILNIQGNGATNVTYDPVAKMVTIDSTDTNTTYSADGNYGLTLSGTTFRLEDDRRRNSSTTDIYTGNTHDFTFYDASVGIRWYTAGIEDMRLQDDGTLHVDGDVIAYSTTISDQSFKDDVVTIDNAIDKVKKLRGVEYTWNSGSRKGKRDLGLIAQEVEEVLPEIVHEHEMPLMEDAQAGKTYKTVDYEKMVGVLIEAMKEQQSQIDFLKAEVELLKGE